MIIDKMVSLFSDEKLREAFEEFQEHEETQVLKDGILRDMVNLIEKQTPNPTTMLIMISVKHALLREMATRYYKLAKSKGVCSEKVLNLPDKFKFRGTVKGMQEVIYTAIKAENSYVITWNFLGEHNDMVMSVETMSFHFNQNEYEFVYA